jgi:serine/threonine-protein kinase
MLDDKYRIERLLATGGMGAVYLGTHVGLRKRVAIKIVNPLLNSAMIERFHREAVTASQIGHEGIAQVTDIGTSSDGEPFLVMEYLEGESLASRLKAIQRFAIEDAAELGCAILSPLAAAHRAGIVHRDLKPDNVYLTRQSRGEVVKLLDFGISRTAAADRDASFRLTTTGLVLGTPYYMSPEQARGESEITPAADLYAFGVILYEMLVGEVPIRADNYNALMYRVSIGDFIPPRVHRPEIPEGLEHVILWAMARTAEERPASALDLEHALLAFCRPAFRDHATGPRATPRPPLKMPPLNSLRPTLDTSDPSNIPSTMSRPAAGSGGHRTSSGGGDAVIDAGGEATEIDAIAPGTPSPLASLVRGSANALSSAASVPPSGPNTLPGHGVPPSGPSVLPGGPSVLPGPPTALASLRRGSSSAMTGLPRPPTVPPAPHHRAMTITVAAVATLAAAGIVAAVMFAQPGRDAAPTAPTRSAAPASAPVATTTAAAPTTAAAAPAAPTPAAAPVPEPRAAPPADTITVTFAIDPASAAITLDGAPVAGGQLDLPRDGAIHRLRISAAGYVGYDERLRFDENQRLVLALKRVPPTARTRPRRDPSLDGIESQSPYR